MFASQFGLEFVLYAKKKPNLSLIQSRPHVVYFNGSPTGHCLASVESGAPNHDGLIGRTDTANSDGCLWGGVCVLASMSHRRTGQHPFGGADRVLPEWIQWGGGSTRNFPGSIFSGGGG